MRSGLPVLPRISTEVVEVVVVAVDVDADAVVADKLVADIDRVVHFEGKKSF